MSSRLRLYTAMSSPSACTWILMPSSLASTATGAPAPSRPRASATVGALEASIGNTGRPTCRVMAASASSPSARAATATIGIEPANMAARRTASTPTENAAAIAGISSPSSAPCRVSPVISPARNACSPAVAAPISSDSRDARTPCEPVPASSANSAKAASTAWTVRVGSAAGAGRSVTERQPTPVRRCLRDPDR